VGEVGEVGVTGEVRVTGEVGAAGKREKIKREFCRTPFTYWLQDFNFNIVDLADSVQLKSAPKSVQYQYGNKTKPARQKITNSLLHSILDLRF
jgi:hypothetical protein